MKGQVGFPLEWPHGWTRTAPGRRGDAPYRVSFTQARDELLEGLRLLGARDAVISSNVPLRRDGLPGAIDREPADPGVAVYWTTRKGEPRVMACDRWRRVRENVRALGLAIEGFRAIERSGATQILERAYLGFAALPAVAGASVIRSWREVLDLSGAFSREFLEARYRELARKAHPDIAGGSHAAMAELNRARDQAIDWLGGNGNQ